MMKRLLSLVLVFLSVCPGVVSAEEEAELPRVEVYEIRKYEEGKVKRPETILEISNPTERTFYIDRDRTYDIEVLYEGKWMRASWQDCYVGLGRYPLRPRAKMLVTVSPAWEEEATRLRYYFFMEKFSGPVVSVRSRAIQRKELGEKHGYITRYAREGHAVPVTDEELNKQGVSPGGSKPQEETDVVERPVPRKVPVAVVYGTKGTSGVAMLEISNPTERTFYFQGHYVIEQPFREVEVKRREKWMATDLWKVGDAETEVYPLKPGAKMLVNVQPSNDEESRFRFLFYTKREIKKGEVVSVRSRGINPKELAEPYPGYEISTKDKEVKEPVTDEELNRRLKEGEPE